MPRKHLAQSEPTPVAETIGEIMESREAKSRIEPDHPTPEPQDEAVDAFRRHREREHAVDEQPRDAPERPVKTWGETVRAWTSHGRDTGVRHVSTTSPDMTGVAFPREKPRTDEEKREMEAADLRYFREAQAWLKPNRDGAFEETQAMAARFAERRRELLGELER